MNRTVFVGVRFEPDLAAKLKRLARDRHQTVSQVLRMLAEQWAAKQRIRRAA